MSTTQKGFSAEEKAAMRARAKELKLAAEGESMVAPLETVERGYASLVDRLRGLGAQVERVE